MPGGLLQIVTHGSQDIFLTGNPEITYFKIVYRRYTNFSVEAMNINFDDSVGFGNTSHITIPKMGDLIHNMYLIVDIPEINFNRTLDQSAIDQLIILRDLTQINYNTVKEFISVNMAAYRAAYNLFLSDNISTSLEIINAISTIFLQYDDTNIRNLIVGDQTEYNGITFRYNTTSGGSGRPLLGNICLKNIVDYWTNPSADPNTVSKNITMDIINFLIKNCEYLDAKYFTLLYNAKNELLDAYNINYKFAWVDKLGHSLIDYVDFYIGGNKIDRHTGQWIDIQYELMGKKLHSAQYDKLIGNISKLTTFNRDGKPTYKLKIPMCFFFNKFTGLSLPLIALQYDNVSFNVKFRKFSECSYIEDDGSGPVNLDDLLENQNLDITANFLVEYVFLDSNERRIFAQSGHEYLIHQLQLNYEDELSAKLYQFDLNFEHSCLGLIWVLQRNSLLKNPDGHTKCYWTTYTTNIGDEKSPILKSKLLFNNYVRVDDFDSTYYNYLQPLKHCKNSPSVGINNYWFSLFPYEYQPSGTCNMSRIPKIRFEFLIDSYYFDNDETYTLSVYALNYNILRIIGGMGNVAYTV